MSALVFSPESSSKLLVSSWDKNVYHYDLTNGAVDAKLVNTYEHRAPVLDVCFGADDDEAYTAGMDWAVNRYMIRPFPSSNPLIFASHLPYGQVY